MTLLAGVDEAGRGPLAGAVYAAAVILDPQHPIEGLNDSKKLSAKKREHLASMIKQNALAWCIASASVEEIDQVNILQATFLAMQRAVAGLQHQPHEIWVDGNRAPYFEKGIVHTLIQGDALEPAISAASILAKTARDAHLLTLDTLYPQYGFAQHKGYPTKLHLALLAENGVSPVHRKSFAPVKRLIALPPTAIG